MRQVDEKVRVEEASFRAGKAEKLLPKVLRVIGRRAGVTLTQLYTKMGYQNSQGSFVGYLAKINGTKDVLRLNVRRGDSDNFVSIDLFTKGDLSEPTYTIDLNGFNIVQLVDVVAEVITGEWFKNKDAFTEKVRALNERRGHKELIQQFLGEFPDMYDEVSRRGTNWDRVFPAYSDYAQRYGLRVPSSIASFRSTVSQALRDLGDTRAAQNVPTAQVRRGEPEEHQPVDDAARARWEALRSNAHIRKFEMMKKWMKKVASKDKRFKNIYIYGQGGIGKSYHAEQILGDHPDCSYYTGGISGYTGLLQVLYDNKDNRIIVFDDVFTDKDMKNKTFENILKAALDPDEPRHISILRRGSGQQEESVDESRYTAIVEEEEDGPQTFDFTSDAGVEVDDNMYDFDFNSWVVFITNYKEVPQPLDDRVWKLEMIFNNEQIADIITNAMEGIYPEIPVGLKTEVLDFMREFIGQKQLSFRAFERGLVVREMADGQEWEDELFVLMDDA